MDRVAPEEFLDARQAFSAVEFQIALNVDSVSVGTAFKLPDGVTDGVEVLEDSGSGVVGRDMVVREEDREAGVTKRHVLNWYRHTKGHHIYIDPERRVA